MFVLGKILSSYLRMLTPDFFFFKKKNPKKYYIIRLTYGRPLKAFPVGSILDLIYFLILNSFYFKRNESISDRLLNPAIFQPFCDISQ